MENWLLAKQAEILAIEAEIQGMMSENVMRERQGSSPAYGEDAFNKKADQLRCVAQFIMNGLDSPQPR